MSWCDDLLCWVSGFANAEGGRLEIGRNDEGNKPTEGTYLKRAALLLFHHDPEHFVTGAFAW